MSWQVMDESGALLASPAMIADLQKTIAELRAAPVVEWIKCADRLPPVGVEVLIRIPVCGRFNVEGGSYQGDGKWYGAWCATHGNGKCYKVTQWAPMPVEAVKKCPNDCGSLCRNMVGCTDD